METTPQRPALFQADGTPEAPDNPALLGGACDDCGGVFFPMQTYGCESCGSQAVRPKALAGRGRLSSFARVHMHAGGGRQAPFTVGTVMIDAGIAVRALIERGSEDKVRHGAAMVAVLVPETRPDRGPFDLQFKVIANGEN